MTGILLSAAVLSFRRNKKILEEPWSFKDFLSSDLFDHGVLSEKQGNAPCRGKRDYNIDYPRENGTLTSAYPRDKVETEYTDETPVKSADNQQRESKLIHKNSSFRKVFGIYSLFRSQPKKRYNDL